MSTAPSTAPTHTVAGLAPILATPFATDGSLDLPSLRRLTAFQLDSGVQGVAVHGMASEGFALTAAERRTVLGAVVDVVAGAVPVVAGVNGTSTVTAIEQAREAIDAGASVLMVLPPFMVKPSPEQVVAFYADVAEVGLAGGTEVMVQDAPGVTGVAMSVDTIRACADLPGVTSVKVEAPPTAAKAAGVAAAVPAEFAVLGGQNAQLCLAEYEAGAVGTMPAAEFPDLLAPILRTWADGDRAAAHRAFAGLLPLLVHGLQPGLAWAVHKEVMVARGLIDTATVRAPARALPESARAALHAMLAAVLPELLDTASSAAGVSA